MSISLLVLLPQCGWTALMRAAMKGRSDCVRLLLERGADVNADANVRDA